MEAELYAKKKIKMVISGSESEAESAIIVFAIRKSMCVHLRAIFARKSIAK